MKRKLKQWWSTIPPISTIEKGLNYLYTFHKLVFDRKYSSLESFNRMTYNYGLWQAVRYHMRGKKHSSHCWVIQGGIMKVEECMCYDCQKGGINLSDIVISTVLWAILYFMTNLASLHLFSRVVIHHQHWMCFTISWWTLQPCIVSFLVNQFCLYCRGPRKNKHSRDT